MQVSNIDKFKSRKEWSDNAWRQLLKDIKHPALSASLDSLLSSYEKNIIINRFAAVALIKDGRTYREIGRELWLSPNTIRSLKRVLENHSARDYKSYRLFKNDRTTVAEKREAKQGLLESSEFVNWVDYCISVYPKKNGPRWKFFRNRRRRLLSRGIAG